MSDPECLVIGIGAYIASHRDSWNNTMSGKAFLEGFFLLQRLSTYSWNNTMSGKAFQQGVVLLQRLKHQCDMGNKRYRTEF